MAANTPDNLLKLASELSNLGAELAAVGGKLASAATLLEQEAANVALENSKRWGVDVQVAVRAGPYGTPGSFIEVKK
ncbi:uncharacterized protein K460DRAFT_281563 [Cucurbitaria berberidis CBS 394.84]|uniref:Uncharacterized protein n=1 Tax=Cucurbitaria berberidis CBS 394.84 TaxID=1168544 RepID=A0A9P4GK03_9PLEO|nr:uncharacterized protein K460DRAFT_281563 [Cucurbitaria berberidis CBS 394.84]KAF1847698.1 hypothetical protein K460DRAFT_281563 [Cucurbitaria berberidis CBS 394.84]